MKQPNFDEIKKAMVQVIIGRELFCWQVFLYPIFFFVLTVLSMVYVANYSLEERLQTLWFVVISMVFIFLPIVILLTIREVKDISVQRILALEQKQQDTWFTISGVERFSDNIVIVVTTIFGKKVTLYSNKVDETPPNVDKYIVACALSSQWGEIAQKLSHSTHYKIELEEKSAQTS